MKAKDRFSIDKSNRFIIKRKNKALSVNGRFSVDRYNRLIYWLNEPISWRKKYDLSRKITLEGNWKLNKNHDLEFNLAERIGEGQDKPMVLRGDIISTEKDNLVFEIKSIDKRGLSRLQLIKLSGSWQADELNRVVFIVKKKALADTLTLRGSWQLNRNQQVIYTYEKADLKRKTKTLHTLTFAGFWQINNRNRLVYIFSSGSKSQFDLRAQLESPNLYPQEKTIKYRIGVGLKRGAPDLPKIISLYGAWKFHRRLGILFEMDYGRQGLKAIQFAGEIHLNKKNEFVISLVNNKRQPLGITVTFSRRFLKGFDAETFVRLKKMAQESAVEAGVRIPF